MALINAQPRSSDSNMDFEHTATMKELQEMTISEKEYESPHKQPAFSFALPARTPPSTALSPAPRSTSKAEQQGKREKIDVFKDEVRGNFPAWRASQQQIDCKRALNAKSVIAMEERSSRLHSRSKSDSAAAARPALTPRSVGDEKAPINTVPFQTNTLCSMRQDLIQQLKHFSEQRAELMQKMQTLDRQENRVLAQLMGIESRAEPLQPRLTCSASAITAPPLSRVDTVPLVLPMPVVDFTSSQPEKTTHKSLPPKAQPHGPASASSKSTPSATELRTPRTSDRIAFAERTAHGTSKATPLHAVQDAEASPMMLGYETDEIVTENEHFNIGVTPLRRTRSMRVPMKFGDNERSGTRNDERGYRTERMATPAVRPTDKIRRVDTPARTPGLSKFYEVPHTVARKRWAF